MFIYAVMLDNLTSGSFNFDSLLYPASNGHLKNCSLESSVKVLLFSPGAGGY